MLPFPYTRPWSRLQKALIIAASVIVLGGFAVAAYSHHHSNRLPHESILFGTWQMTAPHETYTLGLYDVVGLWDGVRRSHWHDGSWVRHGAGPQLEGYSEMGWYAGGSNIYMRVRDERLPRIWEIIDIGPEELRLRYAKQDYVFRRIPD